MEKDSVDSHVEYARREGAGNRRRSAGGSFQAWTRILRLWGQSFYLFLFLFFNEFVQNLISDLEFGEVISWTKSAY